MHTYHLLYTNEQKIRLLKMRVYRYYTVLSPYSHKKMKFNVSSRVVFVATK